MENTMANIAQFDNDIRSERCAGGMKEAMRDGRYVWMAPIGYDNVKMAGKATIAPNEMMCPIVKRTFELIASGVYPTEVVRRMVTTKNGLLNKKQNPICKSYFYTMLTNELYAGWIIKFGERHKGVFEPIISEELFNQVQSVLKNKGRKNSPHITDHPDFPLRRFVVNENGKKLTGSWSRGGRLKKYPFYRFGGSDSNHNRDEFEKNFMKFLEKYRFDDNKFEKLKKCIENNLVKATEGQQKDASRLKKYIVELTEKQSGIIKKNLDGIIPDTVLKQQLAMIDRDLGEANASLAIIPNTEMNFEKALAIAEEYLKNPSKIWRKAKIGPKVKLQWFQFPLGLTFENNLFGTPEIASLYKTKEAFLPLKSAKVDPSGLEPLTSSLQMRRSTR